MQIPSVDKYQSLVAWQSAHTFVLSAFRTTDKCYHARARLIFDQLRRAALSIEANIVEGYALETTAQFRRHLVIARGSAAESECLVRIAQELGYIREPEICRLAGQVDLVMKTLCGLVRSQSAQTGR